MAQEVVNNVAGNTQPMRKMEQCRNKKWGRLGYFLV